MTDRTTLIETARAFTETCHAWSLELQRQFGKAACAIRYLPEGKGEPGSELRQLHDLRESARIQWERARYMIP